MSDECPRTLYELADETYAILDKYGWTQHVPINRQGNVCLDRAALLASGGNYYLYLCFVTWVDSSLGKSITYFNDREARSVADIKALLAKVPVQ